MNTIIQRRLKRILRHITQRELAESLGVTQGAVSHWVHGVCEPSMQHMAKIKKISKTVVNS